MVKIELHIFCPIPRVGRRELPRWDYGNNTRGESSWGERGEEKDRCLVARKMVPRFFSKDEWFLCWREKKWDRDNIASLRACLGTVFFDPKCAVETKYSDLIGRDFNYRSLFRRWLRSRPIRSGYLSSTSLFRSKKNVSRHALRHALRGGYIGVRDLTIAHPC